MCTPRVTARCGRRLLELFPRSIDTGSQYGTVTVRKGGVSVECTALRTDGDYTDGRRPDVVTFGRSLKQDLDRCVRQAT